MRPCSISCGFSSFSHGGYARMRLHSWVSFLCIHQKRVNMMHRFVWICCYIRSTTRTWTYTYNMLQNAPFCIGERGDWANAIASIDLFGRPGLIRLYLGLMSSSENVERAVIGLFISSFLFSFFLFPFFFFFFFFTLTTRIDTVIHNITTVCEVMSALQGTCEVCIICGNCYMIGTVGFLLLL
ncbi:hypothetical protein V8C37DRAFT_258636 [Trichoderma ceciliae]